ncbi:hypothetical protein SAMN05216474_1341 [Lishizhenia tianjinensis]|uniref:Uncharacterized protein n=1 Tax=Lishizhenia tianjinensis TaxID=477690 RepID=A0A1I6Z0Z5_9FLAO|nr:hypothetical protein [Lishizhenia tianjinensis]SFT56308.1 hypothetical protein SAMN05216474_1341 [Lishizhenia tianjinensis]
MDSGVEHLTDLGLVNYVQHPSNKDYIVYRFADKKRAISFESALKEHKIWFEKSEDTPRTKTFYLYGIHKRDNKKVSHLNFTVEAAHRSFLIKNNFFRYFVLLFVTAMITLACMGYCAHQKVLEEKTLEIQNTQ